MGKQGPCYHCGVTSTPLWRNGPPEKPVLCNACGSRWRTKGTLANYTPLHSRADMVDFEEHKAAARVKSISQNKNKEVKFLKRKQSYDNSMTSGGVALAFDYNQFSHKFVDEETSNRSSSGSAMSNSDAQFGSADVSDLTGPAQSVVWDSMVPSRKRTCVNRLKQSSVEKLTKDLHAIMNEQQSSCFSGTTEEDLLLESVTTPMCSFEMGNGAVLFRNPSSIVKEEESEASSLSVDRKQYSKSSEVYYSQRAGLPPHLGGKGLIFPSPSPRIVKIRKSNLEQDSGHEKLKRDMLQREKLQILGNHNSPLQGINLKDVINFEEFVKQLTDQEQEQLLKYLPSVDTTELPHSLRNLFDSSEFKENLSSFQKLLADGVFDNSLIGVKAEECKTLKGLALSNFAKSKWIECHNHLIKESRNSSSGGFGMARSHAGVMPNKSVTGKRGRDVQSQNFVEMTRGTNTMMVNPKRGKGKGSSSRSRSYENDKELVMESDGCCFSPTSLFALPSEDGRDLMLDSSNSNWEQEQEQEQEVVIVDVPLSSFFPQAELLLLPNPLSSLQQQQQQQQSSTCSSSVVSPHPLHSS